jgi:hypothetical protein
MRTLVAFLLTSLLAVAASAGDVWPDGPTTGVNSDFTINPPADGGNQNDMNELVGVPRISGFTLGALTDGSETVVGYIDADPEADWTSLANMTDSTSTTIYRGYPYAGALKLVVDPSPDAGDGVSNTLAGGDQDWSGDDSFGLWMRCDLALAIGDWRLAIRDEASDDTTTVFPAYPTANTWMWVGLDHSTVVDADKNVITDLKIVLSSAGATTFASGGTCYFANAVKWDSDEEEPLSDNVANLDIYYDGVISLFQTKTDGSSAPDLLIEGTDFFVVYLSGADAIVMINDGSTYTGFGYAAVNP